MSVKRITMLAVAVAATALAPAPASAGHAATRCRFAAVSQATVTGPSTYEGWATGYVLGNPGESVGVRCVVKVNTAVVAATFWSTGTTAATTDGRVTFTFSPGSTVRLCAQYTTAHGPGEECFDTSFATVRDAHGAYWEVQRLRCYALAQAAGNYGIATIGPDGDVNVLGVEWHCPPFTTPQPDPFADELNVIRG